MDEESNVSDEDRAATSKDTGMADPSFRGLLCTVAALDVPVEHVEEGRLQASFGEAEANIPTSVTEALTNQAIDGRFLLSVTNHADGSSELFK